MAWWEPRTPPNRIRYQRQQGYLERAKEYGVALALISLLFLILDTNQPFWAVVFMTTIAVGVFIAACVAKRWQQKAWEEGTRTYLQHWERGPNGRHS